MGTKEQTMKDHLQGVQKRMLKGSEILYDREIRKSLDSHTKSLADGAKEAFQKKVERVAEYRELVKEYNEKEVFFLTLSTLEEYDLSTRKKLLAEMYEIEKNDGMVTDTFKQLCQEAGIGDLTGTLAIVSWNSEMTVEELAMLSAAESFNRTSSWMQQSTMEKVQSMMTPNKSNILNPTTYDPEYTTYPKLESVKGTKAGTTGQKSEGVGETSKLKDADSGGGISKEAPGNAVTNKFPDEALPPNGKVIDYYIEDGKIKGINGLNEVDFVITKDGELIIGNKHHYLGQGQDVMAAGQLKINGQGQIKRIDNLSGHYRPTVQEAMSYEDLFKNLNLNTDKTWLQYYRIEADDLGFITQDPILEYSKMLKE